MPAPESSRLPPAQLRLVSDTAPGISRRRSGQGFRYTDANGRPLRDRAALDRIRRLAIPPAWTDIWIAADARAHLQATGRDARGRKQYRYHTTFRAAQEQEKFGRLAAFSRALPSLRRTLRRDLGRADRGREQVLALLVSLLEATYIRVGNDAYTRDNGSYGLTTLEDRHVTISGETIAFAFRGKGGKDRRVELRDRRLARLVKCCRDIRGPHLFQYIDARGHRRPAHSSDLNAYLGMITGQHFTAKDFRTWGATLLTARLLDQRMLVGSRVPGKSALIEDVAAVAAELGNTPAICRKSYIHPLLLETYLRPDSWSRWRRSRQGRPVSGLSSAESRLLRFLTASTSATRRAYQTTGRKAG
ncbi:MAG: DNA topoisomerase IB [Gemmatimonadota bacterium]